MTDDESDRGVLDVLMGAAAGSALLPFVQAIVTKGGEDVYAKIKELLSRPDRKRTKDEIKDSGTVTLFSDDTRVVLRMPSRMTPQMTERLKLVRLPPRGDEWLRVSWDNAKNQWVVRECDPPDELTSGR